MPVVLVIEDDQASLDLMAYLLQTAGYSVCCATDGAAGIRQAIQQRPDLILCDIGLPDVDGYAVLAAISRHPGLATVPVVAVTAAAGIGDRQAFLRAGFTSYLAKPLEPDAFLPAVERLLDATPGAEN